MTPSDTNHNPRVGGSSPSSGIEKSPANTAIGSLAGGADGAYDFSTDFSRGPLRGRGGCPGWFEWPLVADGWRQVSNDELAVKSVGRFGRLRVCKGYARTNNNSKASGRTRGGSAPSPGAGRLVSQRQDKLGLRGRADWSPALPSSRTAHPLHAPHARRLARRAASAVAAMARTKRRSQGPGDRGRAERLSASQDVGYSRAWSRCAARGSRPTAPASRAR
jgi:hypothetical protein